MSEAMDTPHPGPPRGTSKRQKWSGEQLAKRRKIDRDAQRAVRERTKNQISAMERTIETLLQNQGDGRLQMLTRRLRDQEEETARLKKILKSIDNLIQTAAGMSSVPAADHDVVVSSTSAGAGLTGVGEDMMGSNMGDPLSFQLGICRPAASSQLLSSEDHNIFSEPTPVPPLSEVFNRRGYPFMEAMELPSFDIGMPATDFTFSPAHPVPTIPTSYSNCVSAAKPIWEQVDDSLSKARSLRTRSQVLNTSKDADICIRAVLQGWSSVEQRHVLDPGWQILRYVDKSVFSSCGLVERIAIMRVMRLTQLRDVSLNQNLHPLPSYMALRYERRFTLLFSLATYAEARSRPTQKLIKHPKIVDYFVWPELRDHLILAPQKYPPELLARLIPANVRFSWPYTHRTIYIMNAKTGLYSFSTGFDARFQDLGYWTLCSDFFQELPELIGVVPISNPRPYEIEMPTDRILSVENANNGCAERRAAHGSMNDIISISNIGEDENIWTDSGVPQASTNNDLRAVGGQNNLLMGGATVQILATNNLSERIAADLWPELFFEERESG